MTKKILAAAKKARIKYKKKKVVKKVTPLERRARLAKAKKSRKAGLGIKKPKARKADTLPPMVIPLTKPKRKIPKDVTKRTSPKRKVPMRKSATERERRVKFAKENPLMPRSAKPPSVPSRLRGRPAFDPRMLLGPLSIGAKLGAKGAKGVRAIKSRSKTRKRKY